MGLRRFDSPFDRDVSLTFLYHPCMVNLPTFGRFFMVHVGNYIHRSAIHPYMDSMGFVADVFVDIFWKGVAGGAKKTSGVAKVDPMFYGKKRLKYDRS